MIRDVEPRDKELRDTINSLANYLILYHRLSIRLSLEEQLVHENKDVRQYAASHQRLLADLDML